MQLIAVICEVKPLNIFRFPRVWEWMKHYDFSQKCRIYGFHPLICSQLVRGIEMNSVKAEEACLRNNILVWDLLLPEEALETSFIERFPRNKDYPGWGDDGFTFLWGYQGKR